MDQQNSSSFRPIANLSVSISIVVLVLQIYVSCYPLFDHFHWTSHLTDEILQHTIKTGILDDWKGRAIIIFFLLLSLLAHRGRRSFEISRRAAWRCIIVGAIFFWTSPLIFIRVGDPLITDFVYLFITLTGYLLLMTGGSRLLRALSLPWSPDDPFGKKQSGFPQERRRINGAHSLNLRSNHIWQDQRRDGWINLINPRRGILILGSPGSGKSWFIIEPLMEQLIAKGQALFLYDFKFDTLSRLAWQLFQKHRDKYPDTAKFYCIQFSDLTRTHRCNLLEPSTLRWVSDALGASRTILLSMNRTWIDKQGEFFVESPINFLGALIWYLRNYQQGQYCTLPHVIELAQIPYQQLFPILEREPEIKALIDPFIEAWKNKTFEMLDGQVASARIPLSRLASPDLYYVLTGNDFSLTLNDPAAPKIFCLGTDPARQEALAPVLSLYIDRMNRLCNQPERYPLAMVCDEFATVRAYSMTTTIATGRSNNIVPILAVQDLSQLRTQYTHAEADLFLNITGNLFCGQVGGETARWISERFPRIRREKPAISVNSRDTSITRELQWEPTVNQATIAGLSSGEFVGVVSDDPDNPLDLKAFHAHITRQEPNRRTNDLIPIVTPSALSEAARIFHEVKSDIRQLVVDACS